MILLNQYCTKKRYNLKIVRYYLINCIILVHLCIRSTNKMKTVKYIRVSTTEQNISRQKDKRYKNYIDKCSGAIPFQDRPAAKQLLADIFKSKEEVRAIREKGSDEKIYDKNINHIIVHSISRLGRSTIDILKTIEYFTGIGVCVEAEKEGFKTLDRNGRENTTAKLVISIMATLSEFEREMILERQREGIAKAKERGVYAANGGRPKEKPELFLMKDSNRRVLKLLQTGSSIREASFRAKVSQGTVQKVKKVAKELGMLDVDKVRETIRQEERDAKLLREYLKK